jgi:hypothetical protein
MPREGRGEFLRRRNALWARLRLLEPDDPAAGPIVEELCALTGLSREQVAAGLGWA